MKTDKARPRLAVAFDKLESTLVALDELQKTGCSVLQQLCSESLSIQGEMAHSEVATKGLPIKKYHDFVLSSTQHLQNLRNQISVFMHTLKAFRGALTSMESEIANAVNSGLRSQEILHCAHELRNILGMIQQECSLKICIFLELQNFIENIVSLCKFDKFSTFLPHSLLRGEKGLLVLLSFWRDSPLVDIALVERTILSRENLKQNS